jgi:eukaryotic-like serine/threonine-protein kinase
MPSRSGVLPPRYARVERVASGGMADIYAAEDTELGRRVAVKVLAERFAGDAGIRERFKREGLAAARLSAHPDIVTIYDVGEWEGRSFIVMELMGGGTLADRIAEGPVDRGQALAWLAQTAAALDAAHAEGIVHRDVKPGNLLLDEQGNLHVSDFGIARVLDEATEGITATGTVLGTAGYLSPEQARGREATPASDVYGLGIVGYELLTGRRPFEPATPTAEAAAHVHEQVRPPSELTDLPPSVDPVFARALAKDPAYRYGSAQAFVDDLGAALGGRAPAGAATTVPLAAEAPTVALRRRRRARRGLVAPSLVGALLLTGGIAAAVLLSTGTGGTGPTTAPTRTRQPVANTTTPAASPPPVLPVRKAHGKDREKGKKKGHPKHEKEHGKGHGKGHGEK